MKDDAIESIKQRLGDPYIGTYLLSLALLKWEFWIVLFSSQPLNEKLNLLRPLATEKSAYWQALFAVFAYVAAKFIASVFHANFQTFIANFNANAEYQRVSIDNEVHLLRDIAGFYRMMALKFLPSSYPVESIYSPLLEDLKVAEECINEINTNASNYKSWTFQDWDNFKRAFRHGMNSWPKLLEQQSFRYPPPKLGPVEKFMFYLGYAPRKK